MRNPIGSTIARLPEDIRGEIPMIVRDWIAWHRLYRVVLKSEKTTYVLYVLAEDATAAGIQALSFMGYWLGEAKKSYVNAVEFLAAGEQLWLDSSTPIVIHD
jgi:hypothetical protein